MGRLMREYPDRYFRPNYAFVQKSDAPPLQAADLLAWLSRNSMMKLLAGNPCRRDFVALATENHQVVYHDAEGLEDSADAYAGIAPKRRALVPPTEFIVPEDVR